MPKTESETQRHQDNIAKALSYFIENNQNAENGIIIFVEDDNLKGKLVFEIKGKLSLEEAYFKKMNGGNSSGSMGF